MLGTNALVGQIEFGSLFVVHLHAMERDEKPRRVLTCVKVHING